MNWKEFKNNGGSITFLVIVTLIACVLIGSFFGTNQIGRAPMLNKVVGVALGLSALGVFFLKEKTPLIGGIFDTDNDRSNFWRWAGVWVLLVILSFCTLVVWHSGPLGTTTNPI